MFYSSKKTKVDALKKCIMLKEKKSGEMLSTGRTPLKSLVCQIQFNPLTVCDEISSSRVIIHFLVYDKLTLSQLFWHRFHGL